MSHHRTHLQPEKMIADLESYASFVASLHTYPDEALRSTIENSHWSVCDVVSHIMKWDENFVQTMLEKIVNNEPVILEEHADVQAFNNQAVENGRTLSTNVLLKQAVKRRADLLSLLKKVPITDFSKTFSAQSSHTLFGFLHEMFVSHDAHHRKQIEWQLSGVHK